MQVCARWASGLPSVDEEPELAVKYAKLLATLANEVGGGESNPTMRYVFYTGAASHFLLAPWGCYGP